MPRWQPLEFTVDRETVVNAAEAAIRFARKDRGAEVDTPLARRLMRVARTAPAFALGDWVVGGCGCLVGTLHNATELSGFDADLLPAEEYAVGMEFEDALIQRLSEAEHREYKVSARDAIVRVVES